MILKFKTKFINFVRNLKQNQLKKLEKIIKNTKIQELLKGARWGCNKTQKPKNHYKCHKSNKKITT